MPSILVTGSNGFIGKNLISTLRLNPDITVLEFNRDTPEGTLDDLIKQANFIYHLAGVNRPESDDEFETHNKNLTERIVDTLKNNNLKTPLLITSSTQAELDNPYGKSKKAAEESVLQWHKESNSPVYVYRLPGVFGKWSKPNYNSVVATFCYNIANELEVRVDDPSKILTLAYIDDVVTDFTNHLDATKVVEYSELQSVSRTFEVSLGDLKSRIESLKDIRTTLVVPNLSDLLNKFLYATFISFLPKDTFDYTLTKNSDNRGWLAEFVKSDSFGQIFISRTNPGITRGDHWHHTKIEKFFVVSGTAEITFRNELDPEREVIRYTVDGDEARVLDIPTGYVHAIKNIGDSELVTLFWANEILNKDRPDTYYEKVEEDK
jgi:UDP-2-acetamido-2,6-beta-L-arabino-hexul-4-ose reductase